MLKMFFNKCRLEMHSFLKRKSRLSKQRSFSLQKEDFGIPQKDLWDKLKKLLNSENFYKENSKEAVLRISSAKEERKRVIRHVNGISCSGFRRRAFTTYDGEGIKHHSACSYVVYLTRTACWIYMWVYALPGKSLWYKLSFCKKFFILHRTLLVCRSLMTIFLIYTLLLRVVNKSLEFPKG